MRGTRTGGRGAAMLAAVLGGGLLLLGAGCSTPAGGGGSGAGGGGAGVALPAGTASVTVAPEASPSGEPSPSPTRQAGTRAPSRPAVTGAPSRTPTGYDPARDITDLTASTGGLTLGRPVNGVRHGELVVTIRNNGPFPVQRTIFVVELPESITADGGDWTGCDELRSRQDGYPAGAKCDKGALGAGETRVYRLGVQTPAAEDGNDSLISRWLVDVWSSNDRDEMHRDTAPENNRKIFRVTRL
ncbi:hypothetical protein ACI2K4_06250 [Micromonospora sp. NPDC050397]|uniref:hypothetical protein n=1 Tax=Micromonospora sp. NPDC050397 TaxID=3364279 RepID=UPI00384A7355